eukprot:TRINITY_DN9795_c0_g1_i1.p1 TRINITY_DN9795_c0_g1~~TRINITY_DN9795_c0_g1_i1.p1  ORF type:complete len:356 (-),score=91.11 TRINITY_DN9795_c0_g1_i1:8-1015(-)
MKIAEIVQLFEAKKENSNFSESEISMFRKIVEREKKEPSRNKQQHTKVNEIASFLTKYDEEQHKLVDNVFDKSTRKRRRTLQTEESDKEDEELPANSTEALLWKKIELQFRKLHHRFDVIEQRIDTIEKFINEKPKEAVEQADQKIQKDTYYAKYVKRWMEEHWSEFKFLEDVKGDVPLLTVLRDIHAKDPGILARTEDQLPLSAQSWTSYSTTIWSKHRSKRAKDVQAIVRETLGVNDKAENWEKLIADKIKEKYVDLESVEDPNILLPKAAMEILGPQQGKTLPDRAWDLVVCEWYLKKRPLSDGGGRQIHPAYREKLRTLELDEEEFSSQEL